MAILPGHPPSFPAGPLAMPAIRLREGDPTLAPDLDKCLKLPQLTQMPESRSGGSLWPFLRRVGESCLFGARALPPILSDLLLKDNSGPTQLRLNLNGQRSPVSRKQ